MGVAQTTFRGTKVETKLWGVAESPDHRVSSVMAHSEAAGAGLASRSSGPPSPFVVGMSTKAALYLRVSTTEQSYENQVPDLERLAHARGFTIVKTFSEKVSVGDEATPSPSPAVRLGAHGRLPPGPFNGMQVISEALPLPQAQALETSLIQQASVEGRFIYNTATSSVPRVAPAIEVPATTTPSQTLLNPKLYAR